LDKLIVVSGGITAALGIGFLIVHSMYPMFSDAYVSGGIGGIIIGSAMMMWGRRLGIKKDTVHGNASRTPI
jgi:hypothetical protein